MIETDVKLFKAEKMNLTDDAGGRRSANVIPYGQENSIFPDISREARSRGKNLMQKIWVATTTDDTEAYMDVIAIVSRPPDDPNVSISIFATPDETGDDKRPDAKNYLEQSIVIGGISPYYLYGLHNSGSGAITVWCRTNIDPPDINSTLILSEDDNEVFVRITRILANTIRTFTDSEGEFTRRIISMQLSAGISATFHGSDVRRLETSSSIVVNIYNALPNNSTKIYSTTRLVEPAEIGDLTVAVDSLTNRVIPANITYLPSVDLNAAGESIALQESGGPITFLVTFSFGSNISLYLGTACIPGSLSITLPSGGTLIDENGVIKSGTLVVGTIDYNQGIVQFANGAPTYIGSKTVTFTPAAPVQRVQNTFSIRITLENRGTVYIATLTPPPAPGTLRVSYLSGGKWYTLRDLGNGTLGSENIAYGTGQVIFTGSTTITLGALPDLYGSIIYTWASPADVFNRAGIEPSKLFFEILLTKPPGDNLVITWNDVSLSDTGSGILTGTGGTGIVWYGEKRIRIYPVHLPSMGQEININYDDATGSSNQETFTPIPINGTVNITLAATNIIPGTVILRYPIKYKKFSADPGSLYAPPPIPIGEQADVVGSIVARDNRTGGWIGSAGAMSYGDGTLTYSASGVVKAYRAIWYNGYDEHGAARVFSAWEETTAPIELVAGGTVTVSYRVAGTTTPFDETVAVTELNFDITNEFAEPIVPRSVRFSLGGSVFTDLNTGIISKDPSPQTGAGNQVATIDYQIGMVVFTSWVGAITNTPTIQTLITRLTATAASACTFRTAGAPIQSGGLSISVKRPDGTVLNAIAGTNGIISVAGIDGNADFQVGVVTLFFGSWILPAGHENEPWYNPNAVRGDGYIFRPEPVLIDTLTYSAVTIRYQPIDAESLGVDPTRFPPDGLMPIFRVGDTILAHHTLAITLPDPVIAGYVANCERTHVTWITIVDATGAAVPALNRFTLNSEAGTVTFANPLNLAGFTQPLTLYHTIADRAVVTDIDIAGIITISRPLRHNFPTGTLVSSALPLRTLQADWDTLFSQQAWLNTWSNSREGNPITAQYNYAQFPPIVTNHHATRQRYALLWKNNTQFDAIGESMGFIGSGDKNNDFSPTNLLTNGPLFTLLALGFGSLWSGGNVLRLNTDQVAEKSIWTLMSVQPSDPGGSDRFEIRVLGDINA